MAPIQRERDGHLFRRREVLPSSKGPLLQSIRPSQGCQHGIPVSYRKDRVLGIRATTQRDPLLECRKQGDHVHRFPFIVHQQGDTEH